MTKLLRALGLSLAGGLTIAPHFFSVLAACVANQVDTAIGCVPTEPGLFASFILKWAVGIGGGLAFLLILSGVFEVITSSGDPEKLSNGKDTITSAVVGLLFIIFAIIILRIIGVDILGIPGFGI